MRQREASPGLTWQVYLRRFLQRRVLPVWRGFRWPALGALALTALLLGHLGFQEHFRLVDEPRSLTRTLYLSLQLFTLESGSLSPPTPWSLDVARFLAPVVTFYTVAVAVAAVLREQLGLVRLRFFRNHVVICGLGQKGAVLAAAFRDQGFQVAAIEQNPKIDAVAEVRRHGVVVLEGSATSGTLLRKARVAKAGFLVSVCGQDTLNAEVAAVAHRLVRGRKGALCAFIHIADLDLCNLLRVGEIGAQEDRSLDLEFFNVYERGARVLLRRYPPFPSNGTSRPGGPHAVVVGLGQLGQSLLVQAARLWRTDHPDSPVRLRFTVIDQAADATTELLCQKYPQLSRVCEVNPITTDIRTAVFRQGDFLRDATGRPDTDTIYVCVDDPGLALEAGLALLQNGGPSGVPVVVRVINSAGVTALLEESKPVGHEHLHVFPLLEEVCNPEVLLGGTRETLARAIHEEYVAHQTREGQTPQTNPAMVAWDALSRTLRESNRDQAADIGAKLAAVGCGITNLTDWDAELLEFTPEEVEALSRMEHDRWMGERLAAGWTLAPGPKDVGRKTHPDLVPYEELTEEKRELDRSAVRGIPRFLARAGFHAYRL